VEGIMKKIIFVVLLMAALCLAFAAEPVAYLIQGKGKVQIIRDQKVLKHKNGELLYNNDEVKTSAESFAAIKYVDGGAAVKVFPNSVMKVTAVKFNKELSKNSIMKSGNVYSKVSNRIKGGYQVETPTTVASVKGTGFISKISNGNKTHVIVLEGEVLVQNKISGISKTVSAGFTAISDETGLIELLETAEGTVSEQEMQEIEETNQEAQKTIRVQVTDDNGNIKYIDISY
jgi:hypothetical protein